ncbi:CCAAT/enhancer-binding protein beta-like [Pollicipes pollicipes]|uniref:CCAAT/enhancer-binding protein beta-like n=1 Tax=Pollicipes pollicipes TaxID=41117 RepID=UPI00188549F8|nr:CCAAT/enhancer-binding protein beta-like [Pollicipes pollicipes]
MGSGEAELTDVANKAKLGGPYGEEFGDLADLGASEVSLDLQAFVNDPHFSDGIFPRHRRRRAAVRSAVDRTSEEYRRRRERNNVAVRRSREKAKVRSRETEERVKLLARENDGLHKRIEILSKELNVLKNLFANVGVLPDQLHREIAKHLGDGFNRPQPPSGL